MPVQFSFQIENGGCVIRVYGLESTFSHIDLACLLKIVWWAFQISEAKCKMTQTCYSQGWAPVFHRIPTMPSKSPSLNCFLLDFSTARFKQESVLKG